MFASEGYSLIAIALGLGVVLAGIGLLWAGPVVRLLLVVLALLIVGFTLYFFRDPARTPPEGAAHLILAPADGNVVEVVEEHDPLYLDGPARRVSIFLSPLNVHVNRIPADGIIEFDQYVSGDYLVAWHPKASTLNERSQLGLRHPSGTRILFKQIAGAVARRIVYHVGVGDTVQAGERFGVVKFGSRMDVLVPPSITFDVRVGDRVRAGETVLARLPRATEPSGTVADALTARAPAR